MPRNSKVSQAVSRLIDKQNTVRAGVISGATYDTGERVVDVAVLMEYGSASEFIPARPFMRNAIAVKKEEWIRLFITLLESGESVDTALRYAGEVMQGDIKDSIAEKLGLNFKPLSQRTLHERRTRAERKTQSIKPLVDSGTLLQSVSYEVVSED